MWKAKRAGGDLTRNVHKNRRARKTECVSGRLHDGESNQDAFTKLPDLVKSVFCKSVVSISLCNGDMTLFSCSGIAIAHQGYHRTRFLTSASLVRAFDGKSNKYYYDLKIEVRHEDNKVYRGFLAEYDLDHNFAVVNINTFLDVHGVIQGPHVLEYVPHGEASVVGRGVSGDLMARSVELDGDLRVSEDDKHLESKTSEAWEGGIVFSDGGKFVGMNLFLVTGRAVFLPWGTICKRLQYLSRSWQKETGLSRSKRTVYGSGASVGGKSNSNSHPKAQSYLLSQESLDLDSMGYPKLPSTMLGAGMILVNTFEETFGDIYGKGVWSKLSENASSIYCNVVALASFDGEKRFFACTGFFILWNGSTIILTSASLIRNSGDEDKIVENLRIEVLLPDGGRREGTLEHYNLHYNIALVTVENHHVPYPANTISDWSNCSEVTAVGRCFTSGTLMATSGKLVSWTGTLDCDFLVRSSCKITKAGIGGPLVTLDGDVLGMNFYDKKIGTPFLLWPVICKILVSFEKISDPSSAPVWKMDSDATDRLNRWPVPMPCWRHPDYVDEDKSDDDYDDDDDVAFEYKYGYDKGERVLLL